MLSRCQLQLATDSKFPEEDSRSEKAVGAGQLYWSTPQSDWDTHLPTGSRSDGWRSAGPQETAHMDGPKLLQRISWVRWAAQAHAHQKLFAMRQSVGQHANGAHCHSVPPAWTTDMPAWFLQTGGSWITGAGAE